MRLRSTRLSSISSTALRSFNPALLFASGEVGVWYDPSDLTTLFQDTAGTTPVTTPGQTVALMLDKSRVQAPEARRNIVFNSDTLGSWLVNGGTNSTITTTNPFGVSTTVAQTSSAVVDAGRYLTPATTVGVTYTSSIWLKSVSGATIVRTGNDKIAGWVDVDLSNGTITAQGAAVTASSIENWGSGWYRVSCRYVATAAGTSIISYNRGATTTTFIMWGAQLEASSTLTTYQPIGASLPTAWIGNHATQATAAQRPTYGIEPMTGRRNLLLQTQSLHLFGSTWQSWLSAAASSTTTAAPDGTTTASKITFGSSVESEIFQTISRVSGSYALSMWARSGTGKKFRLKRSNNGGSVNSFSADFTTTADWQRFSFPIPTNTVGNVAITNEAAGGAGEIEVWGAQLETGSTATAYQRVTTQFDVTEAGVASKSYLRFDGVDDSMQAVGIPFGSTDKASVFTGLQKTTSGMVAQLGQFFNSEPGSIVFIANTNGYSYGIRGTSPASTLNAATFNSPETTVNTMLVDFAASFGGALDPIIPRRNGALIPSGNLGLIGTTVPGITPIGTKTLSIGFRSNNSTYLSGQIYSLIVRGVTTDAATITSTETWVNQRTGAY